MAKLILFTSALIVLVGCASQPPTAKMQTRNPASFSAEHDEATYWLQCHQEATVEMIDAPLIGPDVDGHMSGGPYCKISQGKCVLTEGHFTVSFPSDVTCQRTKESVCPTVAECVHEATEPSRKAQKWSCLHQPPHEPKAN